MSDPQRNPDGLYEWSDETRADFRRKKRGKNLALMAVLIAFVVLVYLVALVRMGGG
jgi:hypothetical protein